MQHRWTSSLAFLATLATTSVGAQAPHATDAKVETTDASAALRTLEGPVPSGTHAVGRRFVIWTDSARRDLVDTTRRRELAVWIWYPAARSPAEARDAVLDEAWRTRRIETLTPKLGPAVSRAAAELRVHARPDAPFLPGGSKHPVLLFTPGLGWLASDYSVLLEDLASHGYVIVGLAPTGFADVVRFPDGREVTRTLGIGEKIGTDQAHVHEDALFALRRLRAELGDSASFLHGRVDLTKLGAFGHSLGGTTALVAAARDSAVRAAVNIDGDPMGDVTTIRPSQPLLLVSSESPRIDEAPPGPSAEKLELARQGLERSEVRRTADWMHISANAAEAYRIRILGTHHLNFEDAALASAWLVTPKERWMRVGPIDGARGLAITAELVRTFFDHTLSGAERGDLLSTPERRFPEVRLEMRR